MKPAIHHLLRDAARASLAEALERAPGPKTLLLDSGLWNGDRSSPRTLDLFADVPFLVSLGVVAVVPLPARPPGRRGGGGDFDPGGGVAAAADLAFARSPRRRGRPRESATATDAGSPRSFTPPLRGSLVFLLRSGRESAAAAAAAVIADARDQWAAAVADAAATPGGDAVAAAAPPPRAARGWGGGVAASRRGGAADVAEDPAAGASPPPLAFRALVLVLPAPSTTVERVLLASGVRSLVTVAPLRLGFLPLDTDLGTLDRPGVFREVTLEGDRSSLTAAAAALAALRSTAGFRYDLIRTAGAAAAAVVAALLANHPEPLNGGKGGRAGHLAAADRPPARAVDDLSLASLGGLTPPWVAAAASGGMASLTVTPPIPPPPRPVTLIVIDRAVDLVTPLLTQWTYEGLAEEALGMCNTTLEVPPGVLSPADAAAVRGEPPAGGAQGTASGSGGGGGAAIPPPPPPGVGPALTPMPPRAAGGAAAAAPVRRLLTTDDEVYAGLRDLNYTAAARCLALTAADVRARYAARPDGVGTRGHGRRTNHGHDRDWRDDSDSDSDSDDDGGRGRSGGELARVAAFVRALPALASSSAAVAAHTAIAGAVSARTFADPAFASWTAAERAALDGSASSRRRPAALADAAAAGVPLFRLVRLLCLVSVTGGGVESEALAGVRAELLAAAGTATLPLLAAAERSRLCVPAAREGGVGGLVSWSTVLHAAESIADAAGSLAGVPSHGGGGGGGGGRSGASSGSGGGYSDGKGGGRDLAANGGGGSTRGGSDSRGGVGSGSVGGDWDGRGGSGKDGDTAAAPYSWQFARAALRLVSDYDPDDGQADGDADDGRRRADASADAGDSDGGGRDWRRGRHPRTPSPDANARRRARARHRERRLAAPYSGYTPLSVRLVDAALSTAGWASLPPVSTYTSILPPGHVTLEHRAPTAGEGGVGGTALSSAAAAAGVSSPDVDTVVLYVGGLARAEASAVRAAAAASERRVLLLTTALMGGDAFIGHLVGDTGDEE
ncbi:hypothetical protein MMPV_001313 [Pyropia vietnamensis]